MSTLFDPTEEDLDLLSMQEAEQKLLDTGLLYAINELVLNPLGLALIFCYDEDQDEKAPPRFLTVIETRTGQAIGFKDHSGPSLLKRYVSTLISRGNVPKNLETLRGLAPRETN